MKDSSTSQTVFQILIKNWEQVFVNVPQQQAPNDGDANILTKVEDKKPIHRDPTGGSSRKKHDEEDGSLLHFLTQI